MPSAVIPCRLQRLLLFHSQIRQDLRLVFSGCDNLMACGAIIGNGLAVGTGVTAVMAAEAARRVHVAKVCLLYTSHEFWIVVVGDQDRRQRPSERVESKCAGRP